MRRILPVLATTLLLAGMAFAEDPPTLVATWNVGTYPSGIAVDAAGLVYACHYCNAQVFAAFDGGLPNPYTLTDAFRRLAQRVGLKAHFHTLRHCHATQMLLLGVHPKIASERLGHSTVDLTLNTYSHALPSMQQEIVEKLDALYRATAEESS